MLYYSFVIRALPGRVATAGYRTIAAISIQDAEGETGDSVEPPELTPFGRSRLNNRKRKASIAIKPTKKKKATGAEILATAMISISRKLGRATLTIEREMEERTQSYRKSFELIKSEYSDIYDCLDDIVAFYLA
ncbi:hypothetical protein GcC1_096023 [Golovinomyces cichoracearum]|uniref:Uncharacterized protein n=1 Tax=Golovinomyces cichoracearum TaxID=62708 RepID=A0A420IBB2_9PEZI|nr:hypothetical protein GcC1_096023 [Golovinomyces cichoracearum]